MPSAPAGFQKKFLGCMVPAHKTEKSFPLLQENCLLLVKSKKKKKPVSPELSNHDESWAQLFVSLLSLG